MSSPLKKVAESSRQLIQEIREGNKQAFEELFYSYYYALCGLACEITKSPQEARDVVQDVFLALWKKRGSWHVNTSLKAYLYKAVRNRALNYQADKKRQGKLKEKFAEDVGHPVQDTEAESYSNTRQLITEIWHIVDSMAERRKYVFILHRRHGLSYNEISAVMGISRKTVENHMGLALEEIRQKITSRFPD